MCAVAAGNDDRLIRATDHLTTRIKMVEFLDLSLSSHSIPRGFPTWCLMH